MHLIVFRDEVLAMEAFVRARVEGTRRFGAAPEQIMLEADPWIEGFSHNRVNLERFAAYSHEQGLIRHAIDRQEIANGLEGGLVPAAHTFLSPNEAAYREIEWNIVRYDYDPRGPRRCSRSSGWRSGCRPAAPERRSLVSTMSGGNAGCAGPALAVHCPPGPSAGRAGGPR